MTTLRQRLATSRCLVGTIVCSDSTVIAEVAALSGIDWVFFDLEHSANSVETTQRQIQAIAGRVLSMVRVKAADVATIGKVLDIGSNGVIVAQVHSAAIARAAVGAAKYPPIGHRGVGIGRAHAYGAGFSDYVSAANRDTSLIVEIESAAAVAAVDEIAAVEGIDGLFIGPYDLSASMGLSGEVRHPAVLAAIDKVRAAAGRAGLPLGIFVATDGPAQDLMNDYQLLLVGSDVARFRQSLEYTISSVLMPTTSSV
jgi:2-keto-3-deoxy-L-rhamnonate aldolase RhmA